MSTCPTPPYTNPMESGPKKTFLAQNRKKPKDSWFSTQKKGGSFFLTPPLPQNLKKVGFKWGGLGGGGGSGPKTHWGMRLLDKIMILQGVKQTIQPLGVGYANRPKKAQNGGYLAFSPTWVPIGAQVPVLSPNDHPNPS